MTDNHSNIQIRAANQDDSAEIASLCQQFDYLVEAEKVKQTLAKVIVDPDQQVWVVVDGRMVIAWIHVFIATRIESASFAEIGGLVVDKNYRHQGIGSMLISRVSEWAKTRGQMKLRVRCADQRKQAHDFYLAQTMDRTKTQYIFDKTLR